MKKTKILCLACVLVVCDDGPETSDGGAPDGAVADVGNSNDVGRD